MERLDRSREGDLSNTIKRKASSFEEYWLALKAWEHRELSLLAARSLVTKPAQGIHHGLSISVKLRRKRNRIYV
jgi:hypothetical protein